MARSNGSFTGGGEWHTIRSRRQRGFPWANRRFRPTGRARAIGTPEDRVQILTRPVCGIDRAFLLHLAQDLEQPRSGQLGDGLRADLRVNVLFRAAQNLLGMGVCPLGRTAIEPFCCHGLERVLADGAAQGHLGLALLTGVDARRELLLCRITCLECGLQ